MRIVLALTAILAMVGCGAGAGDAPGPAESAQKASNNVAAEEAIKKIPPEFQNRAKQLQEQGMKNSGPPPGPRK